MQDVPWCAKRSRLLALSCLERRVASQTVGAAARRFERTGRRARCSASAGKESATCVARACVHGGGRKAVRKHTLIETARRTEARVEERVLKAHLRMACRRTESQHSSGVQWLRAPSALLLRVPFRGCRSVFGRLNALVFTLVAGLAQRPGKPPYMPAEDHREQGAAVALARARRHVVICYGVGGNAAPAGSVLWWRSAPEAGVLRRGWRQRFTVCHVWRILFCAGRRCAHPQPAAVHECSGHVCSGRRKTVACRCGGASPKPGRVSPRAQTSMSRDPEPAEWCRRRGSLNRSRTQQENSREGSRQAGITPYWRANVFASNLNRRIVCPGSA